MIAKIKIKYLSDRLILSFGVALYCGIFQWVYREWLNRDFASFGFIYKTPDASYLALGWILSLVSSMFMPIKLKRPSQFIYWVLYLTVFIPSMFVPLFIALQPGADIAVLMLTMFIAFMLVGTCYMIPLLNIRPVPLRKVNYWYVFILLVIIFNVWVIIKFGGKMRLVSFDNINQELRFPSEEIIGTSKIVYVITWLTNVFNPFLMAWGLTRKRYFLFLIGALDQILMFSTIGAKSAVLSVPLIVLIYLLLKTNPRRFGISITWGTMMLFAILNTFDFVMADNVPNIIYMITSLLFLRTFGIPGLLTAEYHDFFQNHRYTYFSHINVVSLFKDYPYSQPLGFEIGNYYNGETQLNLNAHLWATDGIAGYGLLGMILISICCIFVFWMLDSAAKGHNITMVTLLISMVTFSVVNTSLFTSFLTGGIGVIIIILYLMPSDDKT